MKPVPDSRRHWQSGDRAPSHRLAVTAQAHACDVNHARGREQATLLSGRIEIDDAFVGGEQPGRQSRGGNKAPFVAAVETDRRG